MKVTGSPWIFKLKADRSFRARVVVQGWGKVQCRAWTAVAPSRLFAFALCSLRPWNGTGRSTSWTWRHPSNVNEEVYFRMALGYEETGPGTGEKLVMKLCKSRYGLRQSPQNWWSTIDVYLEEIGSLPMKTYPCVDVFVSNDS